MLPVRFQLLLFPTLPVTGLDTHPLRLDLPLLKSPELRHSREQAILMRNLTRFFVLLFNPMLDLSIKPDPLLKLDLFVALSIVSTCAECTIYRNVNTYINLEPRAHTGNGNGGNDETQARLITERKAFLAALEDPVVALPKILDVIGPAQYDILMETYHGRGGSDYQPPATYLLGL